MTDADDLELGRVIRRLRSHRKHGRMVRNLRGYPYWISKPGDRFWTDEQVCQFLHITPERMKKCLALLAPRQWNMEKIQAVCFKFIDENKRWPTWKDCRNWRENGLPCYDTIQYNMGRDRLIDDYVRNNWKKLTPQMIISIPNLTTRRDAMERYGIEKLIKNGGGSQIQQDDFGILWELPFREGRDFTARYVEVINSTPRLNKKGEPIKRKGSFVYDHYFLRVPPATKTAKDGVAWTFQKDEKEFAGFAAQS